MADPTEANANNPVRRRVLLLSQIHPLTGPLSGAQLRVSKILDALLMHHDVTFAVATLPDKRSLLEQWPIRNQLASLLVADRDEYKPLARWGGWLNTLRALWPRAVPTDITERAPRALLDSLRVLARSGKIDVVWASRSWMAELAREAGFARIAVDVDDFESPLLDQEIARLRPFRREKIHRHIAHRLRAYERSLTRRFSAVIVVKDKDRRHLDDGSGVSVFRVANGVDVPDTHSTMAAANARMLFVGTFSHAPNVAAMQWFASQCLPIIRQQCPAAELVIAGKGPITEEIQALKNMAGVCVVESPAQLQEWYSSARLVVAPIHSGNGTRIKVLEALAHARPLVATTEATVGFELQHDRELLRADTAGDFSEACVRLISDDATCLRLSMSGRKWAERNAAWSGNTKAVHDVIAYVANSGKTI